MKTYVITVSVPDHTEDNADEVVSAAVNKIQMALQADIAVREARC